jgi:hypothetical protein
MWIFEWLSIYKFKIIIIIFSLFLVYYILTRFYGLFAIYNCLTRDFIWKVANGKLSNCFSSEPSSCKNIDKNGIYGFCYDPDYYGVGTGEERGPYGYNCTDWIFDKDECYPQTCELANNSKKWGWCLDNNRAYRGTSCGPDKSYGVNCKKWIWNDIPGCPKKCIKLIPSKSKVSKVLPMCPKKKNLQKCPMKKDDQCICE